MRRLLNWMKGLASLWFSKEGRRLKAQKSFQSKADDAWAWVIYLQLDLFILKKHFVHTEKCQVTSTGYLPLFYKTSDLRSAFEPLCAPSPQEVAISLVLFSYHVHAYYTLDKFVYTPKYYMYYIHYMHNIILGIF